MKRVIHITNAMGFDSKYVLESVYRDFGIYEKYTPSGVPVHQEWLISNNKNAELVIHSFNHMGKADILDIIDNYNEEGLFGVYARMCNGSLVMHRSGSPC